MIPDGNAFYLPIRVYYEDTDAGGVVYYANYLRYFERARTEMLRAAGHDQSDLAAQWNVLFAVRSIQVDYRQPARLDDRLDVVARVAQVGRASIDFDQRIVREAVELCSARVRIACLDATTFRPRALPAELPEVFR
jgi:acyl-CoA thioester hydrolase